MSIAQKVRLLPTVRLGAILALAFGCPTSSNAWGPLAHEATGEISQQHLSPSALKEVKRLLGLEGAKSLGDIANWADQIRATRQSDQPWHSVRIPKGSGQYVPSRDCRVRCAVGAINDYEAQLADKSLPDQQRLVALKYVVHLVADLHQPLHAIAGAGTNHVFWHDKDMQLHKLWDTSIIARQYKDPQKLATEIGQQYNQLASCGTPAEWAGESNLLASKIIDDSRKEGAGLGDDYDKAALDLIRGQLLKASERIACVINRALN